MTTSTVAAHATRISRNPRASMGEGREKGVRYHRQPDRGDSFFTGHAAHRCRSQAGGSDGSHRVQE
jgi:hypothetical protein